VKTRLGISWQILGYREDCQNSPGSCWRLLIFEKTVLAYLEILIDFGGNFGSRLRYPKAGFSLGMHRLTGLFSKFRKTTFLSGIASSEMRSSKIILKHTSAAGFHAVRVSRELLFLNIKRHAAPGAQH
jgi:hypothetical protein